MELSGPRYGTGRRILFYVLSVLVPLLGVVIFFVFRGRDYEANAVARNALIAAIVGFLVYCICCGAGFGGSSLGLLNR